MRSALRITAPRIAARSCSIGAQTGLCVFGTDYGRGVKPQVHEVRAKVFSALRNLGFRETEVRAALEQVRPESTREHASFDGLLREALDRLRPSGVRR